jgi:hypothetical protein
LGLSEADWDDLMFSINEQKCTPFIGAGAAVPLLPLARDIARRWAAEYDYPLDDPNQLSKVAQFMAVKNKDKNYPKRVINEILRKNPDLGLRKNSNSIYEFLGDMNATVYITTNYDSYMERALEAAGKMPVSEFCRWNSYAQDLGISSVLEKDKQYRPSSSNPLVFHLHGVLDHPQSMVLTDDDYLDFLFSISTKGSETILPHVIRDLLSSNSLLFIGYSLEDITFRLIFRVLSGLNLNRGWAVMYRGNTPNEVNEAAAAEYMEEYMKQLFSVKVFYGTNENFANEARNRLEEFKPPVSMPSKPHETSSNYNNIQNNTIIHSNRYTDRLSYDMTPFVGPRPFTRNSEDRIRFFGRDYETDEIVAFIQTNPLSIVFGKSGVGKTSIFNAHVIPVLEKREIQILPVVRMVSIRIISREKSDILQNPYIVNMFQSLSPHTGPSTILLQKNLSDFLREFFPPSDDKRGSRAPQVLIIDQFEELFRLFQETEVEVWRKDFFKQIEAALRDNQLLRIVLVTREGFVNEFDRFKNIIPALVRARYKLDPLQKNSALLAIKGPLERVAHQINSNSRFQMNTMEQVIKSIVDDLVKVKVEAYDDSNNIVYVEKEAEFIEPVVLQVLCQRWWREMTEDNNENKGKVFLDRTDKVEVVLEAFYEDVIDKIIKETGVSEKDIRKWTEGKLITAHGGKAIVLRGKTFTEGLPNQAVEILDLFHLISPEIRSGAIFYELAFDRLIDPIKKSNLRWKGRKHSLFRSLFK